MVSSRSAAKPLKNQELSLDVIARSLARDVAIRTRRVTCIGRFGLCGSFAGDRRPSFYCGRPGAWCPRCRAVRALGDSSRVLHPCRPGSGDRVGGTGSLPSLGLLREWKC